MLEAQLSKTRDDNQDDNLPLVCLAAAVGGFSDYWDLEGSSGIDETPGTLSVRAIRKYSIPPESHNNVAFHQV